MCRRREFDYELNSSSFARKQTRAWNGRNRNILGSYVTGYTAKLYAMKSAIPVAV